MGGRAKVCSVDACGGPIAVDGGASSIINGPGWRDAIAMINLGWLYSEGQA
jgi:hypothetical protein